MADSGTIFDTFPVATNSATLSTDSKYLNAAKAMIYEELLLSCSTNTNTGEEDSSSSMLVWGVVGGKRGRSDAVSSSTAAEDGEEGGNDDVTSSNGIIKSSIGGGVEGDELHPEYLRSHRIHREVFEEASQIVIPEMWNREWDPWRRTRRERIRLIRSLQDKEAALALLQSKNKQHY